MGRKRIKSKSPSTALSLKKIERKKKRKGILLPVDIFFSSPHLLFWVTASQYFVTHFLGGESNHWGPTHIQIAAPAPPRWRACPAKPCNISLGIKEYQSTSHAGEQLPVLCTHGGIRHSPLSCLHVCIAADAIEMNITCCKQFTLMSLPLWHCLV